MSFKEDGFEIRKNFIQLDRLETIRSKMLEIMAPFCDYPTDRPDSLDKCFAEIGAKSQTLKSNCYKMFSRLADLPLMLTEPNIAKVIADNGFRNFTIQATSVFCIEPNDDRHIFLPHQDLVDRMSLKTLQFWIPLSTGKDIGGVAVWKGSHVKGPIKHKWRTEEAFRADPKQKFQKFAGAAGRRKPFGALVLPEEEYAHYERVDMIDYELGDALVLTPYTVHGSIPNRGDAMRWTYVIKIEEMVGVDHFREDTSPFPMDEYLPPFPEEKMAEASERTPENA